MNARATVLQVTVVCAVMSSACVKVPEFSYRDAATEETADGDMPGGDGGLPAYGAVAYTGSGGHVFGTVPDRYELQFSIQGFKFPFSMNVGGTEVLGSGGDGCRDYQAVGTSFAPGFVFAGITGSATLTNDTITIEVAGPPVAKIALDYGTALGCGAQPNGRTTYTLFPDGRITRMDVARMPTTATAADCECESTTDDDWHVESYTSFNRGVINTVQVVGVPNVGSAAAAPNPTCIVGNGSPAAFSIALAWFAGGSGQTVSRPVDNGLVFAKPLTAPTAMITGAGAEPIGDAISTMYVGTDETCSVLGPKIMPYAGLPELELGGAPGGGTPIGISQDGIFGGETSQRAATIEAPGTTVAYLRGPGGAAMPPFAVWLTFPGTTSTKTVTKTPTTPTTTWFYDQTFAARPIEHLFWFPDGLASGEEIRIEAE